MTPYIWTLNRDEFDFTVRPGSALGWNIHALSPRVKIRKWLDDSKITTDQIIEIFGDTPLTTPQFQKNALFSQKDIFHRIKMILSIFSKIEHLSHAERIAYDTVARDKIWRAIILMHYQSVCQKNQNQNWFRWINSHELKNEAF